MKRVLAIVFLLIIVFGAWWLFFKTDKAPSGENAESSEGPIVVNKHSEDFNSGISGAINSYLSMKDAFVNDDTLAIKNAAASFVSTMDSLSLDDLQKDDAQILSTAKQQVSDMKANAAPILKETDLTQMRHNFQMISDNLYPFLKTIGYEGTKLYWQNCPMAFEDQGANWISKTSEIVNPYMGKHHPVYKSGMLNCGENQDSIYVH